MGALDRPIISVVAILKGLLERGILIALKSTKNNPRNLTGHITRINKWPMKDIMQIN